MMVNLQHRRKILKRTTKVLSVLAKYGFDEIFSRERLRIIVPAKILKKNIPSSGASSLTVYQRIRMALEELVPPTLN